MALAGQGELTPVVGLGALHPGRPRFRIVQQHDGAIGIAPSRLEGDLALKYVPVAGPRRHGALDHAAGLGDAPLDGEARGQAEEIIELKRVQAGRPLGIGQRVVLAPDPDQQIGLHIIQVGIVRRHR